jgi:hypothetical protein
MAVTSMSGTAPRSRTSTLGLVGRVDQAEHPLPETVGVGVVDGGHGPQRQQAGEGLAVGVAPHVPPVAGAQLAPEDLDGRVVGPVDEGEDGADAAQGGHVDQPPPARLAAPRARSSWSASTRGSPGAVKARPAAIDSTNGIRTIPAAGTTSSPVRLRSGGEVGQAGRDGADQGHAPVGQPGGGGEQDPEGDHEQQAGQRRRCPAAQPEQEGDAG